MAFSEDHKTAPYHIYNVSSHTFWHSGKMPAAVARRQGDVTEESVEMLEVSKPHGKRVVTFELVRQNRPCVEPDATPGTNEVLISVEVVKEDPKPDARGTAAMFSCRGMYVFALTHPPVYTATSYPAGTMA